MLNFPGELYDIQLSDKNWLHVIVFLEVESGAIDL